MTVTPAQMLALVISELPWQQRYPEIARIVRETLDQVPGPISTTALVEMIMPLARCRGEEIRGRNKFFSTLMILAKHDLANCVERGEPKKGKFGMMRPILWHAAVKPRCPHCGELL